MRVAVIGDIGGHAEELYAALVTLGADPETLKFPDDLQVIQVGDLIHRGPDNDGVLDIVENMLENNPNWRQLLGNHEALYLEKAGFHWPEVISEKGQERLQHWWREGKLQIAASIRTQEHGDMLLTHAGLTAGAWRNLTSPKDVKTAELLLNKSARSNSGLVWRAGTMLGEGTRFNAGPIWAEAGREVIASWLNSSEMPFGLIHGHSSAYWWAKQGFTIDPKQVKMDVDANRMHVTAHVHNQKIIGVDPGFGAKAHPWEPLVLTGKIL